MHSRTIAFISSLLFLPSLATDTCFSCASPELEENWEVTNLPLKPKDLKFTDKCSSDTDESLSVSCSQGVCYEAIIPLNKRVAYVRGCYANFIEETNYTRTNVNPPVCVYGPYGKDTVVDTSKNTEEKAAYVSAAANRWCVNANDEELCNSELKYSESLYTSPSTYFKKCNNPGVPLDRQCIECSHFGGSGDCKPDSTTYCRGPYCVKYDGYLNGDAMTIRTCAPTTPFSGDECVWMESTYDYQLSGVKLQLPYKAWHCYCTGDKCNPSSRVSSSLLFSVVLPIFLSRFIPFFSVA
ncbi:hypothetical protein PMAYCL1PPCAC_26270 [Pristionchus mayeri]|uniref:Uncharacterized protein n=1 Tax=Pristionchus mayeri TaxID=1317129 RepID=A0AAN5D4T8_9BILA|nr:hypothetical protein PMAYCL1PPCAC_26270 [Pristionchus mayeri]